MCITSLIANIHWLPVLIMTIFSFALGAAWHQPLLFGKHWTKENYPENNARKKVNAPLVFGGTAVMHFVALAALSSVVAGTGAINGLTLGVLISLVWIFPTLAGTYLFASRSLKLLAIDAGMYVVLFAIAGLVLGVW